MHEPPDHDAPDEAPEAQDDGGPYPTLRVRLGSHHGGLPVFCEQHRRNQPDGQPNPQRHEDQVVQVAEVGDHIGNQIDRAEGIDGNAGGHGFGVPGTRGSRAARDKARTSRLRVRAHWRTCSSAGTDLPPPQEPFIRVRWVARKYTRPPL